ncbi:YhcH/YjgK/YiaL family protein [Lacrimispora algidixylanolytica]|uniref:YhcH/YjgK/YiaL family protein n=1 Tax=Lacrimispora algidixylanolytica TaxID=94868 RepID=A0A419TCG5_9FIRM|nr:YhcH/YjgK/YiaL family protein [Lacrimispora algidixylanolytica]RKD35132.1 YhcH/YjgK/YiaL family protein [Lacrimispora algidixylanolytica]
MIFGNIQNSMLEGELSLMPKPLSDAICFLKDHDMAAHEPGVFQLELSGVPMTLQVLDLNTAPRESLRPEIHRKNIDVQFLASGGPEEAGFYSDDGTGIVDEDLLDTPRDILFYQNKEAAPEGRIRLIPGSFAIYFPWDVHIPAIWTGSSPAPIRKIVIKVPLKSCLTEHPSQESVL